MKVTLGGDRLGSGNKNKIALRNYERSTHNLTQKVTTSMQCGVLYPFSVIPAMRGDKFEIDVSADARTIPTKGPLFGSFKMQIDYFQYPWRLAQALLHNNPLALGLKMNQVKLPQIRISSVSSGENRFKNFKFSNTCLLKYLGLSGIGIPDGGGQYKRDFNAIPLLAYYEIFKTYYANKQEENAYVIGNKNVYTESITATEIYLNGTGVGDVEATFPNTIENFEIVYNFESIINRDQFNRVEVAVYDDENTEFIFTWEELNEISKQIFNREIDIVVDGSKVTIKILSIVLLSIFNNALLDNGGSTPTTKYTLLLSTAPSLLESKKLQLIPFKLQNIDDMRLEILSKHALGEPFLIGYNDDGGDWNEESGTDETGLPYSINFKLDSKTGITENANPLNGLLVKTYQADLFNAWVRTEWIDGENGIAAITAISTSDGSFTIDTLNLSEKLYNMLNRVAVSDGSYEGWQDAVFTETPKRHIESPVYLGGSSSEIVFEEIVQTSQSTETSPLGSLGGKGKLIKRKGGHISIKVDEASFIIGIVSLTPRINYTQGNEWYMTDLQSMDDIHKPALDGIGFQNLIGEQLAWWDTKIASGGRGITRSTIGKVPAWVNYMTRVDKGFGDFAETDGNGFMLLQRNYEVGENFSIQDATTYIDPQKYNYAFAYTGLDAQNFWVQIYEKVTARRLMSAKQIPNI